MEADGDFGNGGPIDGANGGDYDAAAAAGDDQWASIPEIPVAAGGGDNAW